MFKGKRKERKPITNYKLRSWDLICIISQKKRGHGFLAINAPHVILIAALRWEVPKVVHRTRLSVPTSNAFHSVCCSC